MVLNSCGSAFFFDKSVGRPIESVRPEDPAGFEHQIPVGRLILPGMFLDNKLGMTVFDIAGSPFAPGLAAKMHSAALPSRSSID